ncbi:hypothetical protein HRbin23_00754 [bacterium HR23]|nr:hypothetical protein HRbin23_00754 [bacterium HR23]
MAVGSWGPGSGRRLRVRPGRHLPGGALRLPGLAQVPGRCSGAERDGPPPAGLSLHPSICRHAGLSIPPGPTGPLGVGVAGGGGGVGGAGGVAVVGVALPSPGGGAGVGVGSPLFPRRGGTAGEIPALPFAHRPFPAGLRRPPADGAARRSRGNTAGTVDTGGYPAGAGGGGRSAWMGDALWHSLRQYVSGAPSC